MTTASVTGLVLDLVGTFAFALNGALTAVRAARLDIVGVVTLGMITAIGGGVLRDVLLGALPPATFNDWRYLVVAAGGGLIAFALSRQLERLATPINVFDALGLSLFAVTGATKALEFGAGFGQAILLGGVTAVGGGTLRDVLVRRVPTVLSSELYAIPALLGAGVVVAGARVGVNILLASLVGAALCLVVRLLGLGFRLDAPHPPGRGGAGGSPDEPEDSERDR
ncbi:MAG TPA: TRIC cation channel family protein [Actinomycetospora sp.]|uniref:trimeric intracellular cation channel family protein n=1 Tax=Actinomycetospora sp. TaxID=1872135 RepID=UPI002F413725